MCHRLVCASLLHSPRWYTFRLLSSLPLPQVLYHLVGVIVHKGEASHGHYYSLLKHTPRNTWYRVDDDNVSVFDPEDIPAECFGGVHVRPSPADPYRFVPVIDRCYIIDQYQ